MWIWVAYRSAMSVLFQQFFFRPQKLNDVILVVSITQQHNRCMLNYIHFSDKLAYWLKPNWFTLISLRKRFEIVVFFLTAYEQEATSIEDINCGDGSNIEFTLLILIAISGVTRMKPYGSWNMTEELRTQTVSHHLLKQTKWNMVRSKPVIVRPHWQRTPTELLWTTSLRSKLVLLVVRLFHMTTITR